MPDLPIFGDNRYPPVEQITGEALAACLARFDSALDYGESASEVGRARASLVAADGEGLLRVHRILFRGREGSGQLRASQAVPVFEGQDCPGPQFIGRSLENLEQWLGADSFGEIHPIEQAALTLTRLVDIWPFEFGNRSASAVFSSFFLTRSGYPPFLVLPEQLAEFDEALSAAIRMQTAPLVALVTRCIRRELERACG